MHINLNNSPGSILVVDDDAGIRTLLADYLTVCNYKMLTAADGREGLELLERHPEISAVILDWSMPVMNGAAFLQELPKATWHQNVPVMVVSAEPPMNRGDVRKVLRKPFQLEQLLRDLQSILPEPAPG